MANPKTPKRMVRVTRDPHVFFNGVLINRVCHGRLWLDGALLAGEALPAELGTVIEATEEDATGAWLRYQCYFRVSRALGDDRHSRRFFHYLELALHHDEPNRRLVDLCEQACQRALDDGPGAVIAGIDAACEAFMELALEVEVALHLNLARLQTRRQPLPAGGEAIVARVAGPFPIEALVARRLAAQDPARDVVVLGAGRSVTLRSELPLPELATPPRLVPAPARPTQRAPVAAPPRRRSPASVPAVAYAHCA